MMCGRGCVCTGNKKDAGDADKPTSLHAVCRHATPTSQDQLQQADSHPLQWHTILFSNATAAVSDDIIKLLLFLRTSGQEAGDAEEPEAVTR